LETTNGLKRSLLARAEKMTARAAHGTVCVSESLKKRFLELELSRADKTVVLGPGSSNGVDVDRFRPREPGEVSELREGLGLPPDARVVGFVGRLIKAKGVEDLVEALDALERHVPHLHLLLVGDFEDGDPVSSSVRRKIHEHPRIHVTGFVRDTAPYYGLLDVLALPSYREGFPNVALEAASSAVPVTGYAATGVVDAVSDGVTGTLVPVGDVVGLGVMLEPYLAIPERRQRHGEAARDRVVELFRQELVWQRWVDLYNRLLAEPA
jgi:glycosyltransferase involved in cell wall biosynthesis